MFRQQSSFLDIPKAGSSGGAPAPALDASKPADSTDGSDSTQALRDIMIKGAWESVAIAKIQLEAQRIANIAKAWQGFASMVKSGAQGLSQVG
jgi:hypothetical protein